MIEAYPNAEPGSLAGKFVPQPPPPAAGELKQTMREIEGPFFRIGAPRRNVILEEGDKVELIVSGRVSNEKGVPIPHSVINVWMSDHDGNYDMIGYRHHGIVEADEFGHYEFWTIIPGAYEPREAKHIHVMVQGNSFPITTQLYIEGELRTEKDPFYSDDVLIRCTIDEKGVKHGTFDFVLKQVTPQDNVTPDSLAAVV
jgi:protocatechuate 3,4-dioxygenase beta subunit